MIKQRKKFKNFGRLPIHWYLYWYIEKYEIEYGFPSVNFCDLHSPNHCKTTVLIIRLHTEHSRHQYKKCNKALGVVNSVALQPGFQGVKYCSIVLGFAFFKFRVRKSKKNRTIWKLVPITGLEITFEHSSVKMTGQIHFSGDTSFRTNIYTSFFGALGY